MRLLHPRIPDGGPYPARPPAAGPGEPRPDRCRHRGGLRRAYLPLHRLCPLPRRHPRGGAGRAGPGAMRFAGALAVILLQLCGGPALGEDITGYAQECAARIAAVPAFDCTQGTEIPVTVDGKPPASNVPGMSCDRPSLLPPVPGETTDGQCLPYQRILKLRDDSTAQISAICRQKILRPAGTYLYDEVDIVLHGVASGSTCWFHAMAPLPRRPDRGLDGRH